MFKIIATLLMGLFVSTANAQTVSGAGATFPYPVYSKWAAEYEKETAVKINYQSIGSGGGIKQIIAKTVTFGASDAPLSQEELDKHQLVQWPQIIGGVVMVVNIPGVKEGNLRLDGNTTAEIYEGKITKWNDPKIKNLNPSLDLPDLPILVVRRADGSGTTFHFTSYLSKASASFKQKVGSAVSVEWPVGLGAKGNEGVANNVKITKGAIGYVEWAYAKQNGLTWTILDGVTPSLETLSNHTWPMTADSFIIMHKNSVKPAEAREALKFFKWAFEKGGQLAAELEYSVLSESHYKEIMNNVWSQIK